MYVRFNKPLIGSIVTALLIAGSAFFGSRWIYRDLPEDNSKFPQPSAAAKGASLDARVGGSESTANAPDHSSSDGASAVSPPFSGEADRVTVDLEEARLQLKAWGDDLLNQFPDVPAVEATVEGIQEVLSQVTDRNQQLKEEGVPIEARIKQLANFAEKISADIAKRRHTNELHLQLLRENTELKLKIDRYMHSKEVALLIPPYLLGLSEEEVHALQRRTNVGSSSSGNGVADQKPVHQSMSDSNPTNDSSSTPAVPIRFPDGTLVPQPQQRTLEEDVALTKRFLEFYDKDPSTIGVVDHGGGKFFPLYPNTVYLTPIKSVNEKGEVRLEGQTAFGTADVPDDAPIPAGVRVIELNPEGDPIREYIASGSWREYLLDWGFDPAQYEDLLAELERMGDSTEGANTAVVGAMNDDRIADMGTSPNQTDDFTENYTPDAVESESSEQSTRVDREQRLRSLLRKFGLEDEEHRPKKVGAETTEWQDRPPVREEPEKPAEPLKRSNTAEFAPNPEEESGKNAPRPD